MKMTNISSSVAHRAFGGLLAQIAIFVSAIPAAKLLQMLQFMLIVWYLYLTEMTQLSLNRLGRPI
jgi:hypothetical protein